MTADKFRKKPVVISAWPIADLLHKAACDWPGLPKPVRVAYDASRLFFLPDALEIVTLEGKMRGERPDWLIQGVEGELYPCKPDIFGKTYDPGSLRPTVVVLCGSTRFSHAFREANLRETLAGRIVLSIGCDMRSDGELFADLTEDAIAKIKADLDELHKRKIDLADEVLVLNIGGYVGDSTRSEIEYARAQGKPVRWLESAGEAGQL